MGIQYKKGVLELCVMALLKKRDRYGYEISETLSQKIDIADGTVYPILRKLKAAEHLSPGGERRPSPQILFSDTAWQGDLRNRPSPISFICRFGEETVGG